jgi:sialic acid synthase SpsE
MCTPFDEKSVDLIEELNVEICKIGRCHGREACSTPTAMHSIHTWHRAQH